MERRVGILDPVETESVSPPICRTYERAPFLLFGEFVAGHMGGDPELYGQELIRIMNEYGDAAVAGFLHADAEMVEVVDNPQVGDEHLILYYAAIAYGRGKIERCEFEKVHSLLLDKTDVTTTSFHGIQSSCDIINPLRMYESVD